MRKHKFNKTGINFMYNKVIDESLDAIENDKDVPTITIKVGEDEIQLPNCADTIEILFAAIKECEEIY